MAHLTFRLVFFLPSDNQILCVVSWLLQSLGVPSAVIYSSFSAPFVADGVIRLPLQRPSPHPSAPWHQSEIDLYLINPSFQNPCHIRPATKGAVCCVSVSNHPLYSRAEIWSVCKLDIIKHGRQWIKSPLKPCLWWVTCHPSFSKLWLRPIRSSRWQQIKQWPWGLYTVIFCPYPQVCLPLLLHTISMKSV